MKLTLKEKKLETSDVISFIFESEKPVQWKAGQFLFYILEHINADERGENRYFTNASAPHEKFVRITTRFNERGSSFKKALKNLEIGSKIEAFPPDGDFVVDDASQKMVFIAGGIGITPFRSILIDLEYRNSIKDIVLICANRNNEIVYKAEIEKIVSQNPGLKIHYVVDPEKVNAQKIKESLSDFTERIFYLSGPKGMIQNMKAVVLNELGVGKKLIKIDYFPGYD